ncbi:MAG: phospho-sugar mutase [Bacilli bacterium]
MQQYQQWLNNSNLELDLQKELKMLNQEQIEDAFYTDLSFGTGGMRGVMGVGTNRMNIYTLRRANYGYGEFILKHHKNPSVVIAYDTRKNSFLFAKESAKVLATMGIKCYLFQEVTPTPLLSFAVRFMKAQGGIVVTASHNPPKYNGYKVYDDKGCQLVPNLADEVVALIKNAPNLFAIPALNFEELISKKLINWVNDEVSIAYLTKVKEISINPNLRKNDFKIVFTPLHGTSAKLGYNLLHELGYDVIPVQEQMIPDSDFSTVKSPNPESPEAFTLAINYAKLHQADICLATDPDADRVGLAVKDQNEYRLLTGNQTGAILLYYLVNERNIKHPSVVFNTIVTSELGALIAKSKGIEVISTLTGFKFIGEQAALLEKTNKTFFFGYEESYGYVVSDFVRDKDSLQALLLCSEVANFYKQQGKTLLMVLDEIYQKFGYFIDEQLNFSLEGSKGLEQIDKILNSFRNELIEKIDHFLVTIKEDYLLGQRFENKKQTKITLPQSNVLKYILNDGSWFVLRPSGTEPKMKVYFSVSDLTYEKAHEKFQIIKNAVLAKIKEVG